MEDQARTKTAHCRDTPRRRWRRTGAGAAAVPVTVRTASGADAAALVIPAEAQPGSACCWTSTAYPARAASLACSDWRDEGGEGRWTPVMAELGRRQWRHIGNLKPDRARGRD